MEQHVPSVLTSQQQHHQQQKQQQQQQQQQQHQQQQQNQQQITSQSRRSGPDQNVGRSVGSNGQISNPGPASGNSGNHGHDNGQTNVMASHGLGGPGAVQSSHVGSSQGYSNVNQGHANVLSSLLALSDPQVGSCFVQMMRRCLDFNDCRCSAPLACLLHLQHQRGRLLHQTCFRPCRLFH